MTGFSVLKLSLAVLTQQLVYEGVCVSVAIWPRSAPRMSTAIERGTNTMARGSSLIAADPVPTQRLVQHLENIVF